MMSTTAANVMVSVGGIVSNLPLLLVSFLLLGVALTRRMECPRASSYVLGGAILLLITQLISAAILPHIPRLLGQLTGPLYPALWVVSQFVIKLLQAVALAMIGLAAFMDRRQP